MKMLVPPNKREVEGVVILLQTTTKTPPALKASTVVLHARALERPQLKRNQFHICRRVFFKKCWNPMER